MIMAETPFYAYPVCNIAPTLAKQAKFVSLGRIPDGFLLDLQRVNCSRSSVRRQLQDADARHERELAIVREENRAPAR